MRRLRDIVIALVVICLFLLPGCAALGGGTSAPAAFDQFLGLVLVYEDSAGTASDKELLLNGALSLLDVSLDDISEVKPSFVGIKLAEKLTAREPSLEGYEDILAKLYTIAMYGMPTSAPESGP